MKPTLLAVGVVAILAFFAFEPQSATAKSTLSFTSAQAAIGQSLFQGHCAVCHGAQLQGLVGPALKGTKSIVHGQPLAKIFSFVTTNMPMGAPGSLSHAQYVEVVSFLLRENRHHPGQKPLTYADAMRSHIRF